MQLSSIFSTFSISSGVRLNPVGLWAGVLMIEGSDPVCQDFPDLLFTPCQVEFIVFRYHGIGIQMMVHIFADVLVSAPVPFRSQDGIPHLCIVPDGMVDGPGTIEAVAMAAVKASRREDWLKQAFCTSSRYSGRPMIGAYRKYSSSFRPPIDLAHSGQHHKFFIIVRIQPMVALLTLSLPISLIRFWAASLAPKMRSLDSNVHIMV